MKAVTRDGKTMREIAFTACFLSMVALPASSSAQSDSETARQAARHLRSQFERLATVGLNPDYSEGEKLSRKLAGYGFDGFQVATEFLSRMSPRREGEDEDLVFKALSLSLYVALIEREYPGTIRLMATSSSRYVKLAALQAIGNLQNKPMDVPRKLAHDKDKLVRILAERWLKELGEE